MAFNAAFAVPTGYKRAIYNGHPALQHKVVAPGFPKAAKSAVICAAYAGIAMKNSVISHNKGEYANVWSFNDGSCTVASIPQWALGLPSEGIVSAPAWHIHIGCDVQNLNHAQTVAKMDTTDLLLYFPGSDPLNIYEGSSVTKRTAPYGNPMPGVPLFNGKGSGRAVDNGNIQDYYFPHTSITVTSFTIMAWYHGRGKTSDGFRSSSPPIKATASHLTRLFSWPVIPTSMIRWAWNSVTREWPTNGRMRASLT